MKMQVNISRIEEIVGNDEGMKNTLLQMFVASCDKSIRKLNDSLNLSGDKAAKAWHDTNHDLKGAAYNLGFEELGNYCGEVENANLTEAEKKEVIKNYIEARNNVNGLIKNI